MCIRYCLAAMILGLSAVAVPADDGPTGITIEADDAELDRRTGITHYRGNVRVVQGDLELRGDDMSLHFTDGELSEAAITGDPATFTQAGDDQRPRARAQAREIRFVIATGIIRLRGAARVIQGSDEFASDDISYDTRAERVVAGGEPGGRVQVTITPRRPADDTETGTDEDPEPPE